MAVNYETRGIHGPTRQPLGFSTRLLALCAVFISSDLIAVKAAGFTLRPADLLMAVIVLFTLPEAVGGLDFRWPVGFGMLVLWTVFVLIFVPNTPFLLRSVGYAAWLLLDGAFVFAVVQVINSRAKLKFILRWYAVSFGLIAAFGLLQFLLPFVGVTPPLLRQWWIPGHLARVNGLSYEPSYFAGYMATGWIFLTSLAMHRSALLSRRATWVLIALSSAVLFVCGSRSGWILMIAWAIWNLFRALKRKTLRLGAGVLVVAALGACSVHGIRSAARANDVFLIGTGLAGTSSYSIKGRLKGFEDTLHVFIDNPLIGVSLGGVIPAIASMQGKLTVHQSDTKKDVQQSQGSTAEALAATGIFGFPFYVLYIFGLIWKPRKLLRSSPELTALLNSFIAAMIVMQVQTNILQGYVWLAIALLSACYAVLRAPLVRVKTVLPARLRTEGAA
jgi:O-Antigen ligase